MIDSLRRTTLLTTLLACLFTPGAAARAQLLPTTPAPATEIVSSLRALVEGSPLAVARTGILVASVETGEVLYAREADALLNPASNVKLVTSAAALARLGPEYRFSTEFLLAEAPAKGVVKALHVRGRGDPTMVTERLWAIAGELQRLGLRRVGELVLDDAYFDAERFGPGYDREDTDRAYSAPSGALSLNFNAVEIAVTPADRAQQRPHVQLEPASPFLEVENRAVTVGRKGRARVIVRTELRNGRERVIVEGRVPVGSRPHVLWRRVDEPALYFGHTLASLLELRGVKVGRVRLARAPEGARIVHVSQSEALAEIVRRLNKTSNNFVAEQLLRTLGAELRGGPGTWAKGVEAAEEFLGELGIAPGSYVMRNGSGLNDANRFSARQLVTVLRGMWSRSQLQPEFVVSLPVAARDGTIRWRMGGTAAAGRLRAKTGTLDGVVSLAGYVQDGAGRTLAFAVLVNDSPGRPGVVRAVDALGAALAGSGAPPGGPDVRLAVATVPPPADLAARLRTFYALAKGGDVRNERLLREALREAADPLARLALAECAYLADPESESAQRDLLEASAADPEALPRLWALLPELSPGPVVSSLADLAAEDDAEALRRLVELGGRTLPDARLAAAVEEALAGVAGSAPEETVSALRAAPPAVAEAAAARLAAGFARAEEDDPAFPAALRALAAKGDEGAETARRLLERVDAARTAAGPRPVPAAVQGGR
ncbi:MAG TPA: D-alanyl-D-alanine carboxypeptidase/D-alanyl-D-alanine-endopeptidase [Anaeromyxobacter sp.]|nr:D-alanyl-D-alanine carboxypeptidase/D-alanyl-D-alanine-endopeptidase [Anaeromyxobacter sp.]